MPRYSMKGVKVDENGCPIDSDNDGLTAITKTNPNITTLEKS